MVNGRKGDRFRGIGARGVCLARFVHFPLRLRARQLINSTPWWISFLLSPSSFLPLLQDRVAHPPGESVFLLTRHRSVSGQSLTLSATFGASLADRPSLPPQTPDKLDPSLLVSVSVSGSSLSLSFSFLVVASRVVKFLTFPPFLSTRNLLQATNTLTSNETTPASSSSSTPKSQRGRRPRGLESPKRRPLEKRGRRR